MWGYIGSDVLWEFIGFSLQNLVSMALSLIWRVGFRVPRVFYPKT